MAINEYIKNIQQEISNGKSYEEYVYLFEEYKKYLESVIKQNPSDITAVCQYAAVLMELRYSSDDSIKIMEETLSQFENELANSEKVRLYTNLAFFYDENGNEDKQIAFLEKAVNLKHDTPNAYDALAVCITTKARCINTTSDFTVALPLFEQAARLSNEFRYQYNYATALYIAGNIAKAKNIFEKLYHQDSKNKKAIYGLGVCSYYLDNTKTALEMANLLANIDTDDEVDEFQIAELFYLCGDYANHNAMFDNCKIHYYYDVSWLAPYFYSLRVLGKDSELLQKYKEVVSSKTEEIKDAKAEELDDSYTVENRNEYVAKLQKEFYDIEEAYRKIIRENDKPELSPKLYFVYGCYLIDCPRHQRVL